MPDIEQKYLDAVQNEDVIKAVELLKTGRTDIATLAGLKKDIYPPPAQFAELWKLDRRFSPVLARDVCERKYLGWQDAVRRTRSTY